MRSARSLMVLVVAVAALLGLAQPASAAPGRYVALGDSYSSGSGAGAYYTDGGCQLSANAYPRLWAEANSPSSFAFVACGGAVTADVLAEQVSALTADTRLVTISIGGNDAGFGDVMTTCLLSSNATCAARNEQARNFIRQTLPGRLDNVYAEIADRAPDAQVVVLGYPHIFGSNATCLLAGATKRAALNSSSDTLSAVISARAAAHGFDYIDARATFDTHEVCGSGTDWIKGLSTDGAFHPNAAGQRGGYYQALEALV
ncbi:SGNH/GDSL hydrolase family protein [Streptomyces sp. DSM 44915]|uniref:SGNH/GDSL hydrolase family protein n=1 Tax=Streptomyces chisholmiae TaxID=3075540 RepID=A0ABU2JUU3_9ACTN|nr:SGNH/GDSL hydrolase family protein [Streptomyces sp. DSM 44915]MDT0268758.1 SGNH/GDSL hydrolase family protein [Streptomyces sp. DSM 44915]